MKAATAKQPQPAKTQPDQETTSRPLDGTAGAAGNSAAPAAGAIAEKSPAGTAQVAAAQRDSASRSSASSGGSHLSAMQQCQHHDPYAWHPCKTSSDAGQVHPLWHHRPGCASAMRICQHGVMQILQNRQTAQWARWARSTSRATAALPSVSTLETVVLPRRDALALPLPSSHRQACCACMQVLKQQQTSRHWCLQRIHSKRRPSTSQSHGRCVLTLEPLVLLVHSLRKADIPART
jgi:hypothetical protein